MRLLLDTHAFLWFVTADARLGHAATSSIQDNGNQRLLSMASLWEMAIKCSIGKLKLTKPFNAFMTEQLSVNVIDLLPISQSHVTMVASLPFHHRDPFDRLLVAQSIAEGLALVSAETVLDAYGIKRIW